MLGIRIIRQLCLLRPGAALLLALTILGLCVGPLAAQTTPQRESVGRTPTLEPGQSLLSLSAALGSTTTPVRAGLQWRVYQERPQADGTHTLIGESDQPLPVFTVSEGSYLVHVSYGLASAMKRVAAEGKARVERLQINAGVLVVKSLLGDATLAPNRVSLAVYVPDRSGSEARLIVPTPVRAMCCACRKAITASSPPISTRKALAPPARPAPPPTPPIRS